GAALSGIPFTFFAGTLLTLGLAAIARFANSRIATFFVSLLAVQCVLNALLDLKTVFFLSSPFGPSLPSDALNMANASGVPAIVWSSVWIAVSVAILFFTMRLYVSTRKKSSPLELGSMTSAPLLPTDLDQPSSKVYGGW
ncbi:MAG TPA: M50 family metallopeptidase, partial [Pyrinomonadaceae bacterium]|nr:M50 family metallopeptidase [Pyrinomonadaceae bacterium]